MYFRHISAKFQPKNLKQHFDWDKAGDSAKIFETRPRLWAKRRNETETWTCRDRDETRDFWNQNMFTKYYEFF